MYLTELILKNFQIHKDKIIFKFVPGLNILSGETGKGKSAIIRSLSLLIENKPRKGELKYKSRNSDHVDITLKNSLNNKVRRSKNKYYINDNEKPLKAFGTGVPEPVEAIFPLKSINWKRQFSPMFLIFESGGVAAKTINKYTGMEDQELLISETKLEISSYKSEIKRLQKNNKENQIKIVSLKKITHFKLKAQAIKNLEIQIEKQEEYINRLSDLLYSLEVTKDQIKNKNKIKEYIKQVEKLIEKEKEITEIKNLSFSLFTIIKKLKSIPSYNIPFIKKQLKEIEIVEERKNDIDMLNQKINLLSNIISKVKTIKHKKNKLKYQILLKQKELKNVWNKLGYCPLCERPIEKEHIC